jgi:hypothetical protein
MATFRKRGKSVRVEVYKNGVRQSATFDSMTQAREWAVVTESAIVERKSNHIVTNKTVHDAFVRYAEDISPAKKGAHWEIIRLNLTGWAVSATTLNILCGPQLSLSMGQMNSSQ